jgi:uncharacterized protein YjbJ (UPF0337 family)
MSNTDLASGEQGTLASMRDRLTHEWNHLKTLVRAKFDRLTDDDVHAVDGRYDEFSQRLSSTYGYDQKRAEEEISRFVSEGGASAAVIPSAQNGSSGDYRGMGARVGRDGRSNPQSLDGQAPPDFGPSRTR